MDQAMLSALCCEDDKIDSAFAPDISPDEQHIYLKENLDFVSFIVKKQICKMLIHRGYEENLYDCNEGIAFYDHIDEKLLKEIYNLVYYKLNRL
jgi:hypothetical protein